MNPTPTTASDAKQALQARYARRGSGLRRYLRPPLPLIHWRDGSLATRPAVPGERRLYVGGAGRPALAGFISLDIVRAAGVHVVGDLECLPLPDACLDAVECPAVLEHVRHPQRAVAEIHRALKPGGLVYVAVPFCHPFHAYPEDHYRWSRDGLRLLLHGFEIVDEGFLTGPTATLLTFFLEYVRLWVPERMAPVAYAAAGWIVWPARYLDLWLNRWPRAHMLANTIWAVGRKPAAAVDRP